VKYIVYFCIVVLIWGLPRPKYQLDCRDFSIVKVDFNYLRFLQKANVTHSIPLMLTISPYIFVQSSYQMDLTDLTHESTHIIQQKREGVFFYFKYLGYYVYNYFSIWDGQRSVRETARLAYLGIPYEQEAFHTEWRKHKLDSICLRKLTD